MQVPSYAATANSAYQSTAFVTAPVGPVPPPPDAVLWDAAGAYTTDQLAVLSLATSVKGFGVYIAALPSHVLQWTTVTVTAAQPDGSEAPAAFLAADGVDSRDWQLEATGDGAATVRIKQLTTQPTSLLYLYGTVAGVASVVSVAADQAVVQAAKVWSNGVPGPTWPTPVLDVRATMVEPCVVRVSWQRPAVPLVLITKWIVQGVISTSLRATVPSQDLSVDIRLPSKTCPPGFVVLGQSTVNYPQTTPVSNPSAIYLR